MGLRGDAPGLFFKLARSSSKDGGMVPLAIANCSALAVRADELLKPFEKQPSSISRRNWRQLKADAADAIDDKVMPALTAFADFYKEEYAPACKEDVGVTRKRDASALESLLAVGGPHADGYGGIV